MGDRSEAIAMMHGRLGQFIGPAVFIVAAALLTSVGGLGVVASPATLVALLFVVTKHPSLPFIVIGSLLGGLTALEGGWGVGYLAGGQFSGWAAVTMVAGAVLGAAGVLLLGLRSRRAFLSDNRTGPQIAALGAAR